MHNATQSDSTLADESAVVSLDHYDDISTMEEHTRRICASYGVVRLFELASNFLSQNAGSGSALSLARTLSFA